MNFKWKVHGNKHILGKYIFVSNSYVHCQRLQKPLEVNTTLNIKSGPLESYRFIIFTNIFELYKKKDFLVVFSFFSFSFFVDVPLGSLGLLT